MPLDKSSKLKFLNLNIMPWVLKRTVSKAYVKIRNYFAFSCLKTCLPFGYWIMFHVVFLLLLSAYFFSNSTFLKKNISGMYHQMSSKLDPDRA